MQKRLKRPAAVLAITITITLVMLAALPGRQVCAMRPVAYTNYTFTTPGPFYNLDMYIICVSGHTARKPTAKRGLGPSTTQ